MLDIEEIREVFEQATRRAPLPSVEGMQAMLKEAGVTLDLKTIEQIKRVSDARQARPVSPPVLSKSLERLILARVRNPAPPIPEARHPEISLFLWIYRNRDRALSSSQIAVETRLTSRAVETALDRMRGAGLIERKATRKRGEFSYSIPNFRRVKELLI